MKRHDHQLLTIAADAIARHNLLTPEATVVVGLSGGADSTALLSVLTELGYRCEALHLNYSLRGAESDRDERHASAIAGRLGAPLTVVRSHVVAENGRSIEMICRDLRYGEMERLRDKTGAEAIAVAHHREDQVETFFLNLLRGSGVAGLRGMKPKREGIIRPLLDADRAIIEDYLKSRALTWVTDSSNNSDEYKRNRVRHHVLPALDRVCGHPLRRITESMDFLAEADDLLSLMAVERRNRYTDNGVIDVRRLAAEEPLPAATTYLILAAEGFSRSVTDDITAAASQPESRRFMTKSGEIWELSAGKLRKIDDREVEFTLATDHIEPEAFQPRRDPDTIYFDSDMVSEEELEIRCPRPGDRLAAFGMKGTRPVNDILADAGVTPAERQKWPLLVSGGKILWVIGVRGSRHYAVTSATRRIMRIRATRKVY